MIDIIECGECDGCGEVMTMDREWIECGSCNGTGEIWIEYSSDI